MAVAKTSPLARQNGITLAQLAEEPLVQVYRSTNEGYSDLMFAGLREGGRKLNIMHEASDMQSLLGLVGAGLGHSLVPASFQNIQISNVKYIPLSDNVRGSSLTLAWNADALTSIMKHFIAVTQKLMDAFDANDCYDRVRHDPCHSVPLIKTV